MKQFTMAISNAHRLQQLHADNMHESTKLRHSAKSCINASERFTEFYQSIGINDYFVAERLANTVFANREYIADQEAQGKMFITLLYDMQSPYFHTHKKAA